MGGPNYDVVLFGATGFVGQLTAAHLARHAPADASIALAGRSEEKLRSVARALGVNWPLIVADSSDIASLNSMASQAKVVISTVGPYAAYGLPLVRACAETGTDYVDLTGEVLFARDSADAYDSIANETGARIVHSCGFDSVPSDLAVLIAAEAAAADGAGQLTDTTLVAKLKGGFSGGTIASAIGQADALRAKPALRKVAADKFALSPDRSSEPSGEHKDSLAVTQDRTNGDWLAPFVMASYNTRVVRRSNALLGHRYGTRFRYRELMYAGRGVKGRLTAQAVRAGLIAGFGAISLAPARPLVTRLVPGPGEGPSEQKQATGFFQMKVTAQTTSGATYESVVAAKGDPGYSATAVMLGESALALALDAAALPALPEGRTGGVLTPAVAIGDALVNRLRQQGFSITARRCDARGAAPNS